MDLTLYDIIIRPRITEKAVAMNKKANKLVVEVHPQANKPLIAEALKKLFSVEVEKIGIVVIKGKTRRVRRILVKGKKRKKAIVTLKKGHTLDLMGLSDAKEHTT